MESFKTEKIVSEKMIYTNTNGEQVVLSSEPPFLYSTKEGFETPENEIGYEKNFGFDGGSHIHSRIDVREITITGSILGKSKKELAQYRREFIRVLNPKLAGTLRYINEWGTYDIDVIPQLAPIFSEGTFYTAGPRVAYKFILKALDPYWTDKSEIDAEIPMARVKPMMEFPLNITENFEFARLIAGDVIEIQNNGDVATGAVFTINVNGPLVNPRLYNVRTQEFFKLNGTFITGTQLRISTLRGKKKVEQNDGDGWYNIMTKRNVESTFLQIDTGINYLQLQADSGVEYTTSYIRFEPKILGV